MLQSPTATTPPVGHLPTFTIRPHGLVLAHVPVFEPTPDSPYAVALLSCYSRLNGDMGLVVSKCADLGAQAGLEYPLYHCGGTNAPCRHAALNSLLSRPEIPQPQWKQIYLMLTPVQAVQVEECQPYVELQCVPPR